MADTNPKILQTIDLKGQRFNIPTCWAQLGLTKDYMLALLSRDEYTPVATHQPTETETLYTDPVSGNLAGFHAGQCVIYPDEQVLDGWGLSIAKFVTVNSSGVPTKVAWFHATDLEKRICKVELQINTNLYGAFGTGLWINEYPWQSDAVWDNGI